MSKQVHPIYNFQFFLLCLSSFLFSASFNMLIPELPSHLSSMGGGEHKGLIIALFALTAGLSRPFSGRLADTIGRVPVMAIGSLVCFFCGFLYPIFGTVFSFLALRLLHGFSTGFKPTATSAYVADIVPQSRWGEALGIHGISFALGFAGGPAIGSLIRIHHSLNALFYTSSLFALLSILILANMKETLVKKHRFQFKFLKISKKDIFAREAAPAAIVTFLSLFAYGVILTIIPDWSHHLGLNNKGMFFMVLTIASLMVRLVAGKTSDKYGRIVITNLGLLLSVFGLGLIGLANSPTSLLIGAGLFGIASGILSPALNAWTIDLSHPDHRGKAMATMYIAMEAGIGSGALFSGWFYQDQITKIPLILYFSAFMAALGLAYMHLLKKKRSRFHSIRFSNF